MKGLLKRIGALVLILTMFTQCFGTHVYAAPDEDTMSIEEINSSESGLTESEEEITQWIMDNLMNESLSVSERPQEWWDTLTEEQRLAAEIFLTSEEVENDDSHYRGQSLEEVINILENGEVKIDHFFTDTIFTYMTMDNLYELREMEKTLEELADAIFGIMGVEGYMMPETDEMMTIAMKVSGYSPFSTFDTVGGVEGGTTGGKTHINTTPTGYTDGLGNNFWILKENGEYVYCLDHGKSCSRTYEYSNMRQSTGAAEWLITNYGGGADTTEYYMSLQMAVWALRAGHTSSSAYTYAFSWFVAGGMEREKATAWAQATKNWVIIAEGQSGTCYVVSGPPGSQDTGKYKEYNLTGTPGEDIPEAEATVIEIYIPYIDNFYKEKTATTRYNVQLTKESVITNEALEGVRFEIVESPASGSDLRYNYIHGSSSEEGVDYENATTDDFGQTVSDSITIPYMDDDKSPSGGAHRTVVTTDENGYASTTFVHSQTFKEFYSECKDENGSTIDYGTYTSMWDEAMSAIAGATGDIIVHYMGSTSTMSASEVEDIYSGQQVVYTQTEAEATATINEMYNKYCSRTYRYIVTELDSYTRSGSTDSNGKVLPEITLPMKGFRKNVKDVTTISGYTQVVRDGGTMVAGGKNDADGNTQEVNITNEPWYNQIFINKTDLESGSQILYDTEFEIYEYYQYKVELVPAAYKLYPAAMLKQYAVENDSSVLPEMVEAATLIVKDSTDNVELEKELDVDRLKAALEDPESYAVEFSTTYSGDYTAHLNMTLKGSLADGVAFKDYVYNGTLRELGECSCTDECLEDGCAVCVYGSSFCVLAKAGNKLYALDAGRDMMKVITSRDTENGTFVTSDGTNFTITHSDDFAITYYNYTDEDGSHVLSSEEHGAYIEILGLNDEIDGNETYTLKYNLVEDTLIRIISDGTALTVVEGTQDYFKVETDTEGTYTFYYHMEELPADGDYECESEFGITANSISKRNVDKNVSTDPGDYSTWGQDNYEIVRVTPEIARKMGWSDTTIGMYTVHRKSALDQYTGTTFTDHFDESDKSLKYGYYEYGTIYYTQANQGKFAIVEKEAPSDSSKTGYLGNYEDRDYTKLSSESEQKNNDGTPYATDDQMSEVKMVHYLDLCTDTNQYATYMLTDGYKEYDATYYSNYADTIKDDAGIDVATGDGYDAYAYEQSSLHETIALERYALDNPLNDVLNIHWDTWFSNYLTRMSGINVIRNSAKTDAWMTASAGEAGEVLHHYVGTTINKDSFDDNDASKSNITYDGTYTETEINYNSYAGERAEALNSRHGFNTNEYLQAGEITYDNGAAEKEARYHGTEKSLSKEEGYAFIDEREYGYIRFTKYDAEAERYVTGDIAEDYEAGTDHADADLDGAVYSLYVDESNIFDVDYYEGTLDGKLFWAQPLNSGGYRIIYDADDAAENGFTDKGDNEYEDYAHAYINKENALVLDYTAEDPATVAVTKKTATYHGIQHPDGQYGGAKHNGFYAVQEEQQVFVDTDNDGYADTWTLQDVTLYAGAKVASAQIRDGELEMNGLYLGTYCLVEEIRDAITIYSTNNDDVESAENRWLSFAAGYLADTDENGNPTKYLFQFPYIDKEQDGKAYAAEQDYVHKDTAQVSNQQVVKGGSAQFNKITTNGESSASGNTTGEALEGAGFTVYMLSELSLIKDGAIAPAIGELEGHALVEGNHLVKLFDASGNMVGYEFTKSYMRDADLYSYFDTKYPDGYNLADVNRIVYVKDRGYFYIEDILTAYRNDYYDNNTKKWDFTAEEDAVARIYEDDEDSIAQINKDYLYVENHLNSGSPCEFYGVNGLSEGWVATGVKNEYKLSEIFSNHYGSVRTPDLAWGAYIMVETTTPDDVFTADPVFFTVTDSSSSVNRSKKVTITDAAVVSSLILVKRDAQSGQDVLRAGTSYRLWDYTNNKYVSKFILSESGKLSMVSQRVFTTDEEGRVNAIASLEHGKYRIEELSGPNGYHNTYWDYGNGNNGEYLGGIGEDANVLTEDNMFQKYYGTKDIEVTTDRLYKASGIVSSDNLDYLYIGEYFYNDELQGKLNITKTGEVLVGYENTDNIEYADEYTDAEAEGFNYSKSMMRERSVFESMKNYYDLGTDTVTTREVKIEGINVDEIIPVTAIAYDGQGMGIAAIYTDADGKVLTMNGGAVYQSGVKKTAADGTEEFIPGATLELPADMFVYEDSDAYEVVRAVEETALAEGSEQVPLVAEPIYKYYDLQGIEITDSAIIQSLVAAAKVTYVEGVTEYLPADAVTEVTEQDGYLMVVYEYSTDIYENAVVKGTSDTYIYKVSGTVTDTSYLVTDENGTLTTNDKGTLTKESDGSYTLSYTKAIYDPDINYNYTLTLSDGSTKAVKLITKDLYLSADNELVRGIEGGGYSIEAADGLVMTDAGAAVKLAEENTGETFDFVYEERPLADATYVVKAAEDIKTQDNGDNYWFRKGDIVATVTTANDGEIVDFAPVYNNGGTYDRTYYYGNNNGSYGSLTKEGSYTASEFATTGEVQNQWIASRMSALDISLFGIPAFTEDVIYPNTYYREEVTPIYRRIIKEGASAGVIATDYMSRLEAEAGLDSEGAKVLSASADGFVLTNKESVEYKGATLEADAGCYVLSAKGRSGEDISIRVRESDKLYLITENLDGSAPWSAGDYVEKTASGYRIVHTQTMSAGVSAGAAVDGAYDIGYTTTEIYADATIYDKGNDTYTLYDKDLNAIVTMKSGVLETQAGGIVTQTGSGYRIDYTVMEELTTNQYVTPSLTIKDATLIIKDQAYDLSWDSQSQSFKTKNGVEVTLSPDYGKVNVTTGKETIEYQAYDLLVEYELHYAAKEDIVRVVKDGTLGEVSLYLPLGNYTVEEIKTPYGFLINEQVQEVSFEAADQVKEIVFNTKDTSTQYTDKTMDIWQSKGLTWFVGGQDTIGERLDKRTDVDYFTWRTFGDAERSFYEDKEGFINFFDLRVKAWSDEEVPDADNGKISISKKDITTLEELPGAELTVTNSEGNVVESWVSTDRPHDIVGLADGTYELTEVTAPDGYEQAESITFTVKDGVVAGGTVVMYDAPTEKVVTISKQDITTGKELPGAQLVVTDKSGNAVESWTSTRKPHEIKDLADGKYTLTEITAPDGYTKTESITFTVKDGVAFGGPVVMFDAPDEEKIYISKRDIATKEELPGAKLIVTDKEGRTIDSWTSTDEVHEIDSQNLPDGDYTLTEITAPDGYEQAESITFKVVDGQAVSGPVVMYDRKSDLVEEPGDDRHEEPEDHQWKLGVGIYKADEDTDASLEGAKFGLYTSDDIYNTDGKLIVTKDTLLAVATTDGTGHANFAVDIALMSKDLDAERADHDLVYEKTVTYTYDSLEAVAGDVYLLKAAGSDDVVLLRQEDGTFKTESEKACIVDEAAKTVTYTVNDSIDGNTAVNTGRFHIKELTPPDGYLYDDTVYDVEFIYDDEYTMYIPVYAEHENEPTKVTLNKMDITGQEEVPGATIAVYKIKDVNDTDADGVISHADDNLILIDSWVSTDTAHEVSGLLLSNTEWPRLSNEEVRENIYIFREVIAADGFVRASDIEFKIYQNQGADGWVDASTGETYGYEVMVRMNNCDQEYESGSIISPNEHADSWISNGTEEESTWDYTKVLDGVTAVEWLLVNDNLVLTFHEDTNKETIDKVLKEEDFKDLTFDSVYLDFKGSSFAVDFYTDRQVDERPADSYLHYDQMWYSLDDIHVTMYDDITRLAFDKQDIVTGEDVIGAKLQIIDEEGRVVDSWTTEADEDGNAITHYIEGVLTSGKEYTLIETLAPTADGYVVSNSVKFTVADNGHIQKVVMQDDFTKLEISKADITTGEEVDGAMLEIWSTHANGSKKELIESWTTGVDGYDKEGKPNRHYIDYLPTGDYILTEKMAPEGYLLAEDVRFTIEETGLLQKVQMFDATRVLKVYKYRTGTTQFVPGATIQIYEVPQEYVEYLTDRIQVEMDASFADADTDSGYQQSPEVKDSKDLLEYMTGVEAAGTEHREEYETKLTLKYSLAKADLEDGLTFTQHLPETVSLLDRDLGVELVVKDGEDEAMTFTFGKDDAGYTITAAFNEEYAKADKKDIYNFYVSFNAIIGEDAVRAGGSLSITFKEGLMLKVDAKDIVEVGSDLTEEAVTIKLTDKDLRATIVTKNGPVSVGDLDSGWYIALETKAPSGYILDNTPQVFQIVNTTTEQSLVFYNQKVPAPSTGGGSSSEDIPEEPEVPEVPVPESGSPIGKLVLRFKSGWKWNNVRTEDNGEAGSSIILTIEEKRNVPMPALAAELFAAAAGCGVGAFILYRRKKQEEEEEKEGKQDA